MGLEIISYLVGGALSGLLAGLFGIGGGLVVIPFLAFALPDVGFPDAMVMHVAIATSLANIVVTSVVSTYSHHKRNGVRWDIFRQVLLSCILGAMAGALLAILISSHVLEIIFGLFVFLVAYSLVRPQVHGADSRTLPTGFKLYSSMFGIAGFCSLLGMGGGSLMV
ncbi:MAG: sulfite exporter TauE/SafE family protein, partial [Gammaproteobacteria bacterium]